jgi:hypothetical protein
MESGAAREDNERGSCDCEAETRANRRATLDARLDVRVHGRIGQRQDRCLPTP